LEYLVRQSIVKLCDFHLLPRSKQILGKSELNNLYMPFKIEISRLKGFITKKNLPIEINHNHQKNCLKLVACYLWSNIHQAQELAESAWHQIILNEYERAVALADMALRIDPDCRLAARTVGTLIENCSLAYLYEPAILAINCSTREILVLISNITRIKTSGSNENITKEIIAEAHRRITILKRYLQKLWNWLDSTDQTEVDSYPQILHLIGKAAFSKIYKQNSLFDETFKQIISHPDIVEAINNAAANRTHKNEDLIINEIQFRLWRLLFIDGWLPKTINIADFVNSFNDVLKKRLRWSNTPDGIGKTPGVQYDGSWYVPEEEEGEDPDSSI
jgi:hypothetical protein